MNNEHGKVHIWFIVYDFINTISNFQLDNRLSSVSGIVKVLERRGRRKCGLIRGNLPRAE